MLYIQSDLKQKMYLKKNLFPKLFYYQRPVAPRMVCPLRYSKNLINKYLVRTTVKPKHVSNMKAHIFPNIYSMNQYVARFRSIGHYRKVPRLLYRMNFRLRNSVFNLKYKKHSLTSLKRYYGSNLSPLIKPRLISKLNLVDSIYLKKWYSKRRFRCRAKRRSRRRLRFSFRRKRYLKKRHFKLRSHSIKFKTRLRRMKFLRKRRIKKIIILRNPRKIRKKVFTKLFRNNKIRIRYFNSVPLLDEMMSPWRVKRNKMWPYYSYKRRGHVIKKKVAKRKRKRRHKRALNRKRFKRLFKLLKRIMYFKKHYNYSYKWFTHIRPRLKIYNL
jgi:hypothetical protein